MRNVTEELCELEALIKPVSDYIKNHFDPMTKVIITDERADVYQAVMGVPVERATT